MALLPPNVQKDVVRHAIKEANRLACMLQGTVSLEGHGLGTLEYRLVKRQMLLRLLRTD